MTAAVADLTIERLARIDQRIDSHQGAALRDRWEFGHEMLAARDGAGRLPNGYLAELVERTGKSKSELSYRAQFTAACPTEQELSTAVDSYTSWTELRRSPRSASGFLPGNVVANLPLRVTQIPFNARCPRANAPVTPVIESLDIDTENGGNVGGPQIASHRANVAKCRSIAKSPLSHSLYLREKMSRSLRHLLGAFA
jgi:hypothetical protein